MAAVVSVALAEDVAVQSAGSPIGKVVEMLQGMLIKGKAMKVQERTEFSKFSMYCTTTRKDTIKAIETAADDIVQQTAAIGKALSSAEELAEDISQERAEVARMENELAGAKAIRAKEKTDYDAAHKDFSESIDAVTRATKVLKEKAKDVPQSLLQIQSSSLIGPADKAAIQSFLAISESHAASDSEEGPPQANAYEVQSGGVVAILEKLKLKFEDQKTTLEKEEASTKAAFQLLEQKLTDSIKDGNDTISDKSTSKAKRLETASDTKGDLAVTKKAKASDETKLSDLNTECDSKSAEYDKNQVTRADEIKALETAIGIMSSDSVSGAATKHNMVLVDDSDGSTSLAQFLSEDRNSRRKLVLFLQARANKFGSKYLSLIASRAATDPMAKVKRMIKDLIVKLMEEANSEADQKGYCDSELGTNKVTRDGKTSEVEELTAEVEKLTAELAQMKQSISKLSQEITDLRASQEKSTDMRNEEKATNTETISEAKSAQVAVERATTVLKDFYASAAQPSLLQSDSSESDSVSEEMDEVAHAPYKGMQAGKGGVVGLLETILSDFARLESSTTSAEEDAAGTYNKFMEDTTTDIEVKGVEMEHLEKKSQTTGETIRNLKKELKATQDELDAALVYYEKLKPDCVDTGLSYQDRVEMRKAEIESLQEAMRALS